MTGPDAEHGGPGKVGADVVQCPGQDDGIGDCVVQEQGRRAQGSCFV